MAISKNALLARVIGPWTTGHSFPSEAQEQEKKFAPVRNVSRLPFSKLPASVYGRSLPISQENVSDSAIFHILLLESVA